MTLASADQRHLTQRGFEQALWAAANALRGPVDRGDGGVTVVSAHARVTCPRHP
jgi:hypothetical protein